MTKVKMTVLLLMASMAVCSAQGYHWVNPYYDYNGIRHSGHWQGNPDGNPYNNLDWLRHNGGSYPYYLDFRN
jgi:hypothetical protein